MSRTLQTPRLFKDHKILDFSLFLHNSLAQGVPVYFMTLTLALPTHMCIYNASPHVRLRAYSPQHVAQPRLGRTDAAERGDGEPQEGQRPTGPRAQPPETELRGAYATAQSRPERVGRPPASATAGTIDSEKDARVRRCVL